MPTCPHCGAPGHQQPPRRPASEVLISELDLSARAYNCLRRNEMTTAADLVALTYLELLEIRKLGLVSAVDRALWELGYPNDFETEAEARAAVAELRRLPAFADTTFNFVEA